MTNLLVAIDNQNLEEVEKIISISPQIVNQIIGKKPLIYACGFAYDFHNLYLTEDLYKIIKFLLKSGANINEKDSRGNTALLVFFSSLSCFDSHKIFVLQHLIMKIFNLLLDNGADINVEDNDGCGVLHHLFSENFDDTIIKIVEILIERGVNINKKDFTNKSAIEKEIEEVLNEANCCGRISKDLYDDLPKMMRLLLENGADLSFGGNFGKLLEPVLEYNLREKDKEIARLKKEIEELRHRPGNPGYLEAMKDFENLRKEKK